MKIDFKINITENISCIALAVFICVNSISWLQIFPSMFPILSLLMLITIVYVRRREFKTKSMVRVVMLLFFILLYYYYTFATPLHIDTADYFLKFIVVGISGLILATIPYNFHKVFKYILFLFFAPLLTLINIKTIAVQQEDIPGFLMGISYGILPYLLASLYIILHKNEKLFIKIYAYIVLTIGVIFMVSFGSRGPQLSIILYLFYLIYNRYFRDKRGIVMLLIVVFTTAYFALKEVIVKSLFSGGTGIYLFDKIARLNESSDVSNGRIDIYAKAIEGFLDKPLLGNGIGNFAMYNIVFPHNIFLQFLFECGIIYFLVLSTFIFRYFYFAFNKNTTVELKNIYMFFICASFVGLLFSGYYWQYQSLWFIIGFGLTAQKKELIIK